MTTAGIAIDAIATVGFPIVAFILMYRMARDTIKENTEAVRDLRGEMQQIHRQRERRADGGKNT